MVKRKKNSAGAYNPQSMPFYPFYYENKELEGSSFSILTEQSEILQSTASQSYFCYPSISEISRQAQFLTITRNPGNSRQKLITYLCLQPTQEISCCKWFKRSPDLTSSALYRSSGVMSLHISAILSSCFTFICWRVHVAHFWNTIFICNEIY